CPAVKNAEHNQGEKTGSSKPKGKGNDLSDKSRGINAKVGMSFTAFYIIGVKFYGMSRWCWGISPEGIGTVGMLLNITVTWVVSRLTPPPPETVQTLVTSLREPGDEPPKNVFLYRTLEEKLELRNAELDSAYQKIKSLNQQLTGENTTLGELNKQLQEQMLERQQAEAALEERTQQLQKAQHETEQQNIHLQETLSELQNTQAQLIQTEKMSSLGQLVAGVAHEINNPVSFIHGNVDHANRYVQELLDLVALYQATYPHPTAAIQAQMDDIELDFLMEDLPKLLTSMKMGSTRIQQIVLSLRSFSRMDEAAMKAVDIHDGINSTLLILQNRLKANDQRSDIEIVKDYTPLPAVECYASQLNQVFMNLIVNAIDALDDAVKTGKLTDAAQIRIQTDVIQETSVRIQIANNGPSIPPAIREKLFDPFFTTKPVGKGTGLGLSISYKIITANHQGKIWCESAPDLGTEFFIEIPMKISYAKN
ncbi:MAG: ATP-binding protein, partial [Cyanobacteria bacterium J06632_3]